MKTSRQEKKPKTTSELKKLKTDQESKVIKMEKSSPKSSKEKFLILVENAKKNYDYKDESKDYKGKKEKMQAIYKLNELVQGQNHIANLFIPNLTVVIDMIEANIFRPLPNIKKTEVDQADGIEQEDESDHQWPFLEGIYQLFLQITCSDIDPQIFKTFITPSFVEKFLELFDSQLPSEREYLKNIFHKMYARIVPRRKMMRKIMDQQFQILIHETHKFNGASEILDILASIISGFAVPLRDEHVRFFNNIIVPLHKVQTNPQFFEQLMRCAMLFLTKDRTLSVPLLEALLKFWPFAATEKEILFLTELKEVLEIVDPSEISHLAPKLFKRLIKCIGGDNMHVCDRAMCYFENDYFVNILKQYKSISFPIMVPKINELAENHWQKILLESLQALRTIMKEIDPQAFDLALNVNLTVHKQFQVQQTEQERLTLDKKWDLLHKKIAQKEPDFVAPTLPFSEGMVPKDFNEVYHRVYDKQMLNAD